MTMPPTLILDQTALFNQILSNTISTMQLHVPVMQSGTEPRITIEPLRFNIDVEQSGLPAERMLEELSLGGRLEMPPEDAFKKCPRALLEKLYCNYRAELRMKQIQEQGGPVLMAAEILSREIHDLVQKVGNDSVQVNGWSVGLLRPLQQGSHAVYLAHPQGRIDLAVRDSQTSLSVHIPSTLGAASVVASIPNFSQTVISNFRKKALMNLRKMHWINKPGVTYHLQFAGKEEIERLSDRYGRIPSRELPTQIWEGMGLSPQTDISFHSATVEGAADPELTHYVRYIRKRGPEKAISLEEDICLIHRRSGISDTVQGIRSWRESSPARGKKATCVKTCFSGASGIMSPNRRESHFEN